MPVNHALTSRAVLNSKQSGNLPRIIHGHTVADPVISFIDVMVSHDRIDGAFSGADDNGVGVQVIWESDKRD